MKVRFLALALLVLAATATTAAAAPSPPDVPPLVGVCIDDTTHTGCYRGGWFCVSVSLMVPQCPPVGCTGVCYMVRETAYACVEGVSANWCKGGYAVCVELQGSTVVCRDL